VLQNVVALQRSQTGFEQSSKSSNSPRSQTGFAQCCYSQVMSPPSLRLNGSSITWLMTMTRCSATEHATKPNSCMRNQAKGEHTSPLHLYELLTRWKAALRSRSARNYLYQEATTCGSWKLIIYKNILMSSTCLTVIDFFLRELALVLRGRNNKIFYSPENIVLGLSVRP